MTTELIGIPGATAAKASVAVVARGIGQELADLLSRSEHEHDVFSDWSEFRAASSEGQQWDLFSVA